MLWASWIGHFGLKACIIRLSTISLQTLEVFGSELWLACLLKLISKKKKSPLVPKYYGIYLSRSPWIPCSVMKSDSEMELEAYQGVKPAEGRRRKIGRGSHQTQPYTPVGPWTKTVPQRGSVWVALSRSLNIFGCWLGLPYEKYNLGSKVKMLTAGSPKLNPLFN